MVFYPAPHFYSAEHDLGAFGSNVVSDHEKGGGNIVLFKNVKHLRSGDGVGSVVKGKSCKFG